MEEKYRRLLDDNTSLLKSTLPNFDRTTPPQQMKTIAESLLREKTATVKALQQALSEKQQKSSSLQGVKKTLSDQLTDLTSSESRSSSQ
jgi:septal ring factor EnvC (AmiA/AmiB activator)